MLALAFIGGIIVVLLGIIICQLSSIHDTLKEWNEIWANDEEDDPEPTPADKPEKTIVWEQNVARIQRPRDVSGDNAA